MLETACLFTVVKQIADYQAGGSGGDFVKQFFIDTIDSIAVQKITDYVFGDS